MSQITQMQKIKPGLDGAAHCAFVHSTRWMSLSAEQQSLYSSNGRTVHAGWPHPLKDHLLNQSSHHIDMHRAALAGQRAADIYLWTLSWVWHVTKLKLLHYYFPKKKRGPEASLPPTPASIDGSICCKGSRCSFVGKLSLWCCPVKELPYHFLECEVMYTKDQVRMAVILLWSCLI